MRGHEEHLHVLHLSVRHQVCAYCTRQPWADLLMGEDTPRFCENRCSIWHEVLLLRQMAENARQPMRLRSRHRRHRIVEIKKSALDAYLSEMGRWQSPMQHV